MNLGKSKTKAFPWWTWDTPNLRFDLPNGTFIIISELHERAELFHSKECTCVMTASHYHYVEYKGCITKAFSFSEVFAHLAAYLEELERDL